MFKLKINWGYVFDLFGNFICHTTFIFLVSTLQSFHLWIPCAFSTHFCCFELQSKIIRLYIYCSIFLKKYIFLYQSNKDRYRIYIVSHPIHIAKIKVFALISSQKTIFLTVNNNKTKSNLILFLLVIKLRLITKQNYNNNKKDSLSRICINETKTQ